MCVCGYELGCVGGVSGSARGRSDARRKKEGEGGGVREGEQWQC